MDSPRFCKSTHGQNSLPHLTGQAIAAFRSGGIKKVESETTRRWKTCRDKPLKIRIAGDRGKETAAAAGTEMVLPRDRAATACAPSAVKRHPISGVCPVTGGSAPSVAKPWSGNSGFQHSRVPVSDRRIDRRCRPRCPDQLASIKTIKTSTETGACQGLTEPPLWALLLLLRNMNSFQVKSIDERSDPCTP